jgi:two-component system, chemotaxis family, chemotaxis protein CheY
MTKTISTVMVVEDETLLLEAIAKKLKICGLNPISCSGAEQALDYLNSLAELPDAIWLDYHLKEMNGLDFMKRLKDNPKWSEIPIVVVSNSASPDKVHNMLALGAKKYILKAEHRLDDIIDTIKEFTTKGE